ncbi:MAG TPA: cytochrome b/b6 domain-containing protein [Micropepsaceae bacterium]|nr:cytochrome b/b6 domain-containing protein [Micropepsaceae bacterium]
MALDVADETTAELPARRTRSGKELIYRHTLLVRLAHWINVLCVVLLLMSGMQIFNAHPMLHWGIKGDEADPALFSIYAEDQLEGPPIGWVQIGAAKFNTTGWLGVFRDRDGFPSGRAFPYWITIPGYQSLAEGRRWHFFFAWLFALNGLAYLIYGFGVRHFQRDLTPTRYDLKHIGRSILNHLKLKHPRGEEAKRYNVLQKLTYIAVIFILLPLMIISGLSMSPGVDSAAPWLPDIFGGRQSARTIHFITATLLVLFILVHVIEVLLAGVFNELRSMITGWFAVKPEKADAPRSKP